MLWERAEQATEYKNSLWLLVMTIYLNCPVLSRSWNSLKLLSIVIVRFLCVFTLKNSSSQSTAQHAKPQAVSSWRTVDATCLPWLPGDNDYDGVGGNGDKNKRIAFITCQALFPGISHVWITHLILTSLGGKVLLWLPFYTWRFRKVKADWAQCHAICQLGNRV